jgi:endonuclease G
MPRGPQRNYGFLIAIVVFLWRYPRLHVPLIIIAVLFVLFLLFRGCMQVSPPPPFPPSATQPEGRGTEREQGPPPPLADADVQLLMGNPSGAADDPKSPDNYLMRKPYFALSYNNAKRTPNWVSWCLKKSDLGNAPRPPQFSPDLTLPDSFKRVKQADYNGSGFDRGHMCPHSDRASSNEASEATFVMSNIIPQSPNCNQKAWADLEDHCRDLVRKKHQTLYIVSGPQGQGGEGKEGPKELIGGAKVTVPAKCWKVVLALDGGKGDADDVSRVNRNSRVFAVVMPNDMTVGHDWEKYRTSAKEVEELTGYHFFDQVPAAVIGPLKQRVDN